MSALAERLLDPGPLAVDLLAAGAEPLEDPHRERQRDLPLGGEDVLGPRLAQPGQLADVGIYIFLNAP